MSTGPFSALLCAARGLGPPPTTRNNSESCIGCILPDHNPSAAGEAVAPGGVIRDNNKRQRGQGRGCFKNMIDSSYPSPGMICPVT